MSDTEDRARDPAGAAADDDTLALATKFAPEAFVADQVQPRRADELSSRRATDDDRRLLEEIDETARLAADMTFSALLTALNASRTTLLGEASYDASEILHVRQLSVMGDHVAKQRFARDRAVFDKSRGRG